MMPQDSIKAKCIVFIKIQCCEMGNTFERDKKKSVIIIQGQRNTSLETLLRNDANPEEKFNPL